MVKADALEDALAKKGGLTLSQLVDYDDRLTDALVDRVYFWSTIRKLRLGFHASRGVREEDITDLLQKHVVLNKDPLTAVRRILDLPAIKRYHSSLKTVNEREHFARHLARYVRVYMPDCPFEVCTTNRYTIISHEAAIIARRQINKGEVIKYLCGIQVAMTKPEEQELGLNDRDFSIVLSSRKKLPSLFLGPARFANHDCDANAKLSTVGPHGMQVVATRLIAVGEEITVTYGDNYFGEENCECLCMTCELRRRNGWKKKRRKETQSDIQGPKETSTTGQNQRRPKPPVQAIKTDMQSPKLKPARRSTQITSSPIAPSLTSSGTATPEYSLRRKRTHTFDPKTHQPIPCVAVTEEEAPPPAKKLRRSKDPLLDSSPSLESTQAANMSLSTNELRPRTRTVPGRLPVAQRYYYVVLSSAELESDSTSRSLSPRSSIGGSSRASRGSTAATSVSGQDSDESDARAKSNRRRTMTELSNVNVTDGSEADDANALARRQRQRRRMTDGEVPQVAAIRQSLRTRSSAIPTTEAHDPAGLSDEEDDDDSDEVDVVGGSGILVDPSNARRKPGDYTLTSRLLATIYSRWVECQTCNEHFVQDEAYQTRVACPRCERHSKLYGYTWPKTDKEGRKDTEERVLDHRTVHRFIAPQEELRQRKGRKTLNTLVEESRERSRLSESVDRRRRRSAG